MPTISMQNIAFTENGKVMLADQSLPFRFCWTKYGTESGETVDQIVARKEKERQTNGGVFLWGIGNSIGQGIRLLLQLEQAPQVLFSPMRSKAKEIDISPAAIVTWTRARDLGGQEWEIPRGSQVISRAADPTGKAKGQHYALVCRSEIPLTQANHEQKINASELVNLQSGAPVGPSQVTAVVQRVHTGRSPRAQPYAVAFVAQLVHPYFVELFHRGDARGAEGFTQRSLLDDH